MLKSNIDRLFIETIQIQCKKSLRPQANSVQNKIQKELCILEVNPVANVKKYFYI